MRRAPGAYLPTPLETMTRTNIRTHAQRFSRNTHFVSKAVNFPDLQATTINGVFLIQVMARCTRWQHKNLDNEILVLNFLSPPTRYVDRADHNSLNTASTNVDREFQLGQAQQHVSRRSLKSFIKGREVTSRDFISFVVNSIVSY